MTALHPTPDRQGAPTPRRVVTSVLRLVAAILLLAAAKAWLSAIGDPGVDRGPGPFTATGLSAMEGRDK